MVCDPMLFDSDDPKIPHKDIVILHSEEVDLRCR